MRILILGGNGLIGAAAGKHLPGDWTVVPLSKAQADVTDPASIQKALATHKPDVVFNCTGFMNVDRCESEPHQSHAINCLGPINIAKALHADNRLRRSILVHLSSDFVFDGIKGDYIEEDIAKPLSMYGIHKLVADEFIANSQWDRYYVLRIASVIGLVPNRNNFLKRMISLAKQRDHFDIVDDLKISLCTAELIADTLARLIRSDAPFGLYNTVARGSTSWHQILTESFRYLGIDHDIRPVSIVTMPNAALRPRTSNMVVNKLETALGGRMDDWQTALRSHIDLHREDYLSLLGPN